MQPNFPDWFLINVNYVRGVYYVADNGFSAEKHTTDPQLSAAVLVSCLFVPLTQMADMPLEHASKLLQLYSLSEEQDHCVAECKFKECEYDTLAQELDADDFEFEPISGYNGQPSVRFEVAINNSRPPSWEDVLAKIERISHELTYTRLASVWSSHRVASLVLRLLRRLETLVSGPSCTALAVRLALLLRDRLLDVPDDAPAILAPLLAVLRPSPHAWSAVTGPAAAALAVAACFAAAGRGGGGAAAGLHDGDDTAVRHAAQVWAGGGRAACDAVAAQAETWAGCGRGDGDGEAEAGLVAQSLLLGGCACAGEALLAAGFIRALALRVLAQVRPWNVAHQQFALLPRTLPLPLVLPAGSAAAAAAGLGRVAHGRRLGHGILGHDRLGHGSLCHGRLGHGRLGCGRLCNGMLGHSRLGYVTADKVTAD